MNIIYSGYSYVKMDLLLVRSARRGKLEDVKYSLEYGIETNDSLNKALIYAASGGYLEVVKYLVEQGADVNTQDGKALIYAASRGYLEVVKYLVSQGADVNIQDGKALQDTVTGGYLDIVKYLVSQGADIGAQKYKALEKASSVGNLDLITYLIQLVRVKDRSVVLNKMLSNAANDTTIRLLISLGADANYGKGQVLIYATERGDVRTVNYLVSKGADPYVRRMRALSIAARYENYDVVKYLLDVYSNDPNYEVPYLPSLEIQALVDSDVAAKHHLRGLLESMNRDLSSLIVRYY